MNFLFVDRILELEQGKRTLALKHVTASDAYLMPDTEGRTVIASSIIGEALGQLCTWNIIKSSDFHLRMIGGIVGDVRFHSDVYLGETVVLENIIDSLDLDNQVVHFHGIAKVGDRLILEVNDGLGPLLPIEEFGDVDTVKKEFKHLYCPGDLPHLPEGQVITPQIQYNPHYLSYDHIISWEKGEKVVAQKNISRSAPYFVDHFPKRPVLPLTILLESKLQLAYSFISEMVGDEERHLKTNPMKIKPVAVRRIKMNDFVEPGAVVMTTMRLKTRLKTPLETGDEERIILTFRSEVEGRRVCVCEAEFAVSMGTQQPIENLKRQRVYER